MKRTPSILLLFAASTLLSFSGTPTDILVHVLANDAKLMGTSMGGAWVTVRDLKTGEILSQGKHAGSTGDTNLIVKQPKQRGEDRFPGEAPAVYKDTIELSRPTLVEITAEGPLVYPHAMQKASVTTLLLPGKHLKGEGVVLNLHGFVVDIMSPESVDSVKAGEAFTIQASVRMMCGCPTSPDGLWDSNDFEITAHLIQNDEVIQSAPMKYAGKTNIYSVEITAPGDAGSVEVLITASDKSKANFGMDQMMMRVSE
ncbi:MAG: hypothetical protein P9L94_02940 [Candidatus Hinthialibacter antarcticus]|nr:hypothetical protein [Candidatus Hinthialibacter antarcticus]